MDLNKLTAISPIDGRYRKVVEGLARYFSEYGLIKYRVQVEIEYFLALCELPLPQLQDFDKKKYADLWKIITAFSEKDAQKIKDTEKITNHDVKAVEYFLKEKFELLGLEQYSEFIHFGLTSQDINNTAIPLLLKQALEEVIYPQLVELLETLTELSQTWKEIPMLARTHGQPASPTNLGKEIRVFCERLEGQMKLLQQIPYAAKFGGATGNFNAHHVAYPEIDWIGFANRFVNERLGLKRSLYTTQIEHYDHLGALCDNYKRINTILMDFARDMWQYISMEYFKQKLVAGEIGSSAMPHKVNPIDFENAEGNLGMANAMLEHFSAKLPISRLQRDLTDSTVLRNLGVPFAHIVISLASLNKGITKLELNKAALHDDLNENWAVVAEAIQTILRREGYPKPYEALKELTRTGAKITQNELINFINSLYVKHNVKEELRRITPFNYQGIH